ncbi:MAG: CDP-diacylglycerol--glycerol-3-phosphate 3-phosphatidyltransferase [Thermodesulfobacteria bacterium]|nr:CDP-diacylglycerol--glycerol-3-phosphate 3-phosphatidyltransferase [Thermodesulfobacteriota bacterium]
MTEKLNPNVITLLRILLLPLPCALLVVNSPLTRVSALVLLSFLAFTDYLDGAVARRYKKVSAIGTLLDPIADKIFVTSIYLVLVHLSYLPFLPVALIIGREILVSFLRIWFPEETKVQKFAKLKTFVQMSFAAFVLLFATRYEISELVKFGVWLVVAITYLSSASYFLNSLSKITHKSIPSGFVKSALFLFYPVCLLLIFPFSGKLFWIIIVALDFFFFKKGLAKSSPSFAAKETGGAVLSILGILLEKTLFNKVYYSLWILLGISVVKDGVKSLKFMWKLLGF